MHSDMRVEWIDENYAGEPVFETAVNALGAAWLFDSRIPSPVLPVPPPGHSGRKHAKAPGRGTAEVGTHEGG